MTEPPPFAVLLGPDYAGKSSVMAQLRATVPDWSLVSVDSPFVAAEHGVLSQLKRALVLDTLPGLGTAYSADFVVSLAQTAVVYLRDRIMESPRSRARVRGLLLLQDSRQVPAHGADEHPCSRGGGRFPQPQQVIYLDVAPDDAWRRSGGRGQPVGALRRTPRTGRVRDFQTDLRKLMLDEVRGPPR